MKMEHDYTRETFFGNLKECLYHKFIKKRKLLVRFILKPGELGGKPEYRREETWTDMPISEINAAGFRYSKGLHDSIAWLGTPIYVRIENGKEFPIEQFYPNKKDTAYTLNDAMLSNTEASFKKSLSKAALTAAADWQKIILIAVAGVIGIILTKYFGLW